MSEAFQNIPDRMRRNGRPEDQDFDPSESLFHRCNTEMLRYEANGRIFCSFRVGDTSVNREKRGGEWGDVLLCEYPKFTDWGVLAFRVEIVPLVHQRSEGEWIYVVTTHDPDEDNFFHCEIRLLKSGLDGERVTKKVPPSTKTWFRTEMSQRLSVNNLKKRPAI